MSETKPLSSSEPRPKARDDSAADDTAPRLVADEQSGNSGMVIVMGVVASLALLLGFGIGLLF